MKNDKRSIGRDPHIAPGVYYIQKELCARIDGDRIIVEKKESEDKRMLKNIISYLEMIKMGCVICTIDTSEEIAWLEKQKENPKNAISIPADCASNAKCPYKINGDEDFIGDIKDTPAYHFGFDEGVRSEREKQKEKKPISSEDMPYITDEHFYEREPADSFRYKLAEYMTKNCRKEESPDGYTYHISAESILKMAEEELIKRGVVKKPAEWSDDIIRKAVKEVGLTQHQIDWFKTNVFLPKQEWSEEDEKMLAAIGKALGCDTAEKILENEGVTLMMAAGFLDSLRPQPQGTYKHVIHTIFGMLKDKDFYEIQPSHRVSLLNDIRVKCKDAIECAPILDEPSWKPSEVQMNELHGALIPGHGYDCDVLASLYEQLKQMMEE